MLRVQNNRIFIRIFFSYIIIFILTLVLGSLIYDHAIEITKNEVMTNNANMLGQVREVLDVKLREIDNITKKMIQEPTMNNVINIDLVEGSASYYKVYELVNKMPDYRLSNEILFDYFIFLRDIVV